MNIIKRLLSIASGGTSGSNSVSDEVMECLEEFQKSLAEHATAIGRIERKQNRWIELLNLKKEMNAEPQSVEKLMRTETLGQPGDEDESFKLPL